ncbi:MAG: RagB/SusD family nutrient uptake outer membrane protein [Saprospiraceae bacterium]|nr:RagB/SusD family nutrient uptake outer membrane protein [Saprospiraceae bacterium]
MKKFFINYKYLMILGLFVGITSCENEAIPNPNGPTLESLVDGATEADLLLLASGVESVMRNDLGFYYNTTSIVGRDYYDLNGTDPRYTGELLGAGAGDGFLDNNGFLTTRTFAAGYRAIRNAYVLEEAVANTVASLTQEEINGYVGFTKLVRAYELLKLANKQYNNGIRIDTRDPDNPGAFLDYDPALAAISALLDEATSDFNAGGATLAFNLSSGYDGFSTPAGLAQFAQALKARVEMYRGNAAGCLSALSNSFFDLNGDLDMGVSHAFGTGGNDTRNPVFFVPNQDLYMAHPSFVADAEAGDARLGKVVDLGTPVSIDDLSATHQVQIYSSDVDPIAMIRNEELILLYAEANIGTNNGEAVAALNVIRNAAGLGDYAGAMDDASLVDEMLHQRRYSLFGEGHRWIDMRRYGRLGDLPLDRPGDQVFDQFPTPVSEGN